MDKEEILKKARQEASKDQDEMEQAILTKALGISTIVIPILSIIFILIRIKKSQYIISDLITISLAQLFISQLYQAIKMKRVIFLITSFIKLNINFKFPHLLLQINLRMLLLMICFSYSVSLTHHKFQ